MVFESEKLREAYRGVYKEAAIYGTGLHENLVGTAVRDIYLDEAAPISQEAYDALKPKSPAEMTREALRVLAPSLGVSPPQPKSKLVFYRFNKTRDAVMDDGDVCLQGSMKVRDALLSNFNVGGFKTMFVHYGNSFGWRCKFTAEECDILFLDGPAPAEMQQARGRLTRG